MKRLVIITSLYLAVACKPAAEPTAPQLDPNQREGKKAGAEGSESDGDYRTSTPHGGTQNGSGTQTGAGLPANPSATTPPTLSNSGPNNSGAAGFIGQIVGFGTKIFDFFRNNNQGNGGSTQSPPAPAPTPTTVQQPPTQQSQPSTPTQSGPPIGQSGVQFNAPANVKYNISNYGGALQSNKARLVSAIDAAGASLEEKMIIIAIAMQETTYMSPGERDSKKDGSSSANCSILNLNLDMVQMLGYQRNDGGAFLNDPSNIGEAVRLLVKGLRDWGVPRTLNFIRGGRPGFNDGVSYGAFDYRNSIGTIYGKISQDQGLLTDGRRVEVNLYGV